MFEKLKGVFKKEEPQIIPSPQLKGLIDLFKMVEKGRPNPSLTVQNLKEQLNLVIQWADTQGWSKPYGLVILDEESGHPVSLISDLYGLFNKVNLECERCGKFDAPLKEEDFIELLTFFHDHQEDITCLPPHSKSLMLYAMYQGHLGVAKKLETFGLSVHQRDSDNINALQTAIHRGHVHMIPWLMEKGFEINEKMRISNGLILSPLMAAEVSITRQLETISVAVAYGLNLDMIGTEGLTILHESILHNEQDWVERLVQSGASLEVRSKHTQYGPPRTPEEFACAMSRKGIELYLTEARQVKQEVAMLHQATQGVISPPQSSTGPAPKRNVL